MSTDDQTTNGVPTRTNRARQDLRTVLTSLVIFLVVQILLFGVSRKTALLIVAIVVGALLWKIPPLDIPHHGKFWKLTAERFREAVSVASRPAAGVTLLAVLISPLYALASNRDVLETAGSWAETGVLVGTAVAAFYWIASRTAEDVEILRAKQQDANKGQKEE